MLDDLYVYPGAVRRLRSSPLGPWIDSFVGRLAEFGYTSWSRRSNVVLAADLGRWMANHDVSVESLDEGAVDAYLRQRRTQRERRRAASSLVLAHLRAEGVTPPSPEIADHSTPSLHEQRYAAYMRRERGAAAGTIDGYLAVVRDFFGWRFDSGDVDLTVLTASDVGTYLVERAPMLSPKTLAYRAGALRSFFRFLFLQGETATDLSTAPLMSQTRHRATVPRYLSPAEVDELLDSCDPSTPTGRRDLSILLLLVRLGLRAGEVAALELDDIRWRSGEIVVRGKGDVVNRLPLLSEVGEAISAYLRHDRVANAPTRRVFLRRCAPVRGLGGREAVSTIVRTALGRAGLHPAVRGAHLLRHTLGTRMVRAGASMAEVAEVLRHATPNSSAIYAKVDFEALRALARPWPSIGGSR
ncbi:MAG: tyrosine-type recombinase/integrase [Acidobacteriota bacterium]